MGKIHVPPLAVREHSPFPGAPEAALLRRSVAGLEEVHGKFLRSARPLNGCTLNQVSLE